MSLSAPDTEFLTALDARLPGVLVEATASYLEEPRGNLKGLGRVVAKPRSTADVAEILRRCNDAGVGVIPYAGGTGLVGGQVQTEGPEALILSVERMKAIREVSAGDQTMVAEAGAILSDVQGAASAQGLLFPLSLASEGSCRIGGNLATNAGGVNVVRWGNARDLTLGVEAVLPDGTVINGLKSLRKDNTGYDLRHLLIGSEGTLGIITAARLRLFPQPEDIAVALLDVEDPAAALKVLRRLQTVFGEQVSAFELIDQTGVDFIRETMPDHKLPDMGPSRWKALVEVGGGADARISARFETALEALFEDEMVRDGFVAQSQAHRAEIWAMRETIPEANKRIGAIASTDLSVPVADIPAFLDAVRPVVMRLNAGFRINTFGHLGDGNLHYNIFPPVGRTKAEFADLRGAVMDAVHAKVHAFNGSFSAEHGVGRLKASHLTTYGDPGKVAAMRAIKAALDPKGIMNPGAVFEL